MIANITQPKPRTAKRKPGRPAKPKTYEIWLACKDWDLEPALVYTTTNPDDVRCWKNAVDAYEHQDFQMAAKVNGRQVAIPPPPDRWPYVVHEFGSAEAAADLERCKAEYEVFQRDEFTVYELRGSGGDLVDRDTSLLHAVEHLLSLYVNSDPMGGYVIRQRRAVIPAITTYSVWFADDEGDLIEEYESRISLERARELVQMHDEVNEKPSPITTKIIRHEEYVAEEGGAS